MFSLIRGCGILLALGLWAQVAGAQILIEYPINNSIVTFEDLHLTNGFRWTPVQGATEYEISVYKQTITGVPEYGRFIAKEPPFFVDKDYENTFFQPGHFTWEVKVSAGEGIGATSFQATFQLIDENLLVPTATPIGGVVNPVTPEIGNVRNVTFSPGNEITYGQSVSLRISWDPPSFPEGVSFSYDISLVWPYGINSLNYPNFNKMELFPFSTITTIPGQYNVYIRARTGDKKGEISTHSFNVKGGQPIPTPTPVNRDPDVNKDQLINVSDIAMFVKAFNTKKQDFTYDKRLDFVQDEIIDKKDLLVFVQMFSLKNNVTDAPAWDSVELPIVDPTLLFGCFKDENNIERIIVPIQDNTFTFSSSKCNLAELAYSRFYFKEVPGFAKYQVNITPQKGSVRSPLQVEGDNSFTFFSSISDNEFIITVRTVGSNQELGTPSAPLKVIVPIQPPR